MYLNLRENLFKIPISIQQCYELFFRFNESDKNTEHSSFNLSLNSYKIYSDLVKNGFIVRRAKLKNTKKTAETLNKNRLTGNQFNLVDMPIVEKLEQEKLTQLEVYNRLHCLVPNTKLDELRVQLLDGGKQEKSRVEF